MLWNIIDRRKRQYRWKRVNAIIEATEHDNSCADSDQAPETAYLDPDHVTYDERIGISVQGAIVWANSQRQPVTLFLYDEGDGVSEEFSASPRSGD